MDPSIISPPHLSAVLRPGQRLHNRVAIVTGASSGIGRSIALAYASEGAIVACADLNPVAKSYPTDEDASATHEVIHEMGGKSIFVQCDVGDSQSVQDLMNLVVESYGRLDILVNNAGLGLEMQNPWPIKSIHETEDETFDQTMRVNSRGVFLCCKYAGRQMIKQDPHPNGDRGWIINMASSFGLVGKEGLVSYTASKGAVVQMTRTIALEYASFRIHCNAICPGMTNTAMLKPVTDHQDWLPGLNATHPFKGIGQPEDVAKVAIFLASDDSAWVSGAIIPVDGCYTTQ